MNNPLLARGTPNRHLHIALADLALSAAAACLWQGVFHVPMQDRIPAWVWPVVAGLFLLSAVAAYSRHRKLRARRD
ncbi:hypothetical protein [Lysobacter solisilvae (ex Woo and Kim 2020)]|uniref:Uncharacterized protein n=1 Tax=Agrilutibacter terrestris TaxID=2865112 RepID=A0A7H0FYI2_9GAMM|nr:hypothetical protein [Lysobacter terrestris]QNP41098.1 hypothetical protein H8B22_02395 [Lysobacter terrestris]